MSDLIFFLFCFLLGFFFTEIVNGCKEALKVIKDAGKDAR